MQALVHIAHHLLEGAVDTPVGQEAEDQGEDEDARDAEGGHPVLEVHDKSSAGDRGRVDVMDQIVISESCGDA